MEHLHYLGGLSFLLFDQKHSFSHFQKNLWQEESAGTLKILEWPPQKHALKPNEQLSQMLQ